MDFSLGNCSGMSFSDDGSDQVRVFDGENSILLPLAIVQAFVETHARLVGVSSEFKQIDPLSGEYSIPVDRYAFGRVGLSSPGAPTGN